MTSTPHSDPHHAGHWALRRVRQFWPVIPLLGILFALMLSDLDVIGHMPWSQDECGMKDVEQSSLSAKMYLPLANWALRYTPTPSVAILMIDSNTRPAGLLTNTCESRAFLAKLIEDLNALSAHVIVIDQYFSADYCTEQDKNAKFIAAMEGSAVPVVVGQPTHALTAAAASGGCLALTKRLEFSKDAKVLYGLTRLNADILKIPLRWPVFSDTAQQPDASQAAAPDSAPKPLPAEAGDTLSLAAAKVQDPNIESNSRIAKFLSKGIHPYTTFIDLPQINAMTVLCSAEKDPSDIFGAKLGATCTPWVRPLDNLDGHHLSLGGKVVVIGQIVQSDMKSFPTGEKPGVFLQANYVQSILDHRFLTEIPTGVTLGLLVTYVFFVYCLYWAHDREGRELLSTEQAGLLSLSLLAGICLLSILVLVTTSYFTPLWALWGAGVFIVFRYLEEIGHARGEHLLGRMTEHHPKSPHPAAHVASAAHDHEDASHE